MNEINPHQSIELLKELHILTKDGKMNLDSKRKLKQVYHLCQFIKPLIDQIGDPISIVDHGAGKSYLGFILYDLFLKNSPLKKHVYGIETRLELIKKSEELKKRFKFTHMSFLHLSVAESIASDLLPKKIDLVTALHACDRATDDAIQFALKRNAQHIVLVPCCQAWLASLLKKNKNSCLKEIWRHPLHAREFGSHLTNVLRCLQLEAYGYSVTVTELVGWEHSLKNELIIASYKNLPRELPIIKLKKLLQELDLEDLENQFLF